jgi:hypothetical protein
MSLRTLARLHALGRVAVGGAFALAPGPAGRAWVGAGAGRPEARVLGVAFGIRDLAIGAGAAWALGGGEDARPWILAGLASDAADLAVTHRHRHDLPALAATGSRCLAVSSIALGLYVLAALDRPDGGQRP